MKKIIFLLLIIVLIILMLPFMGEYCLVKKAYAFEEVKDMLNKSDKYKNNIAEYNKSDADEKINIEEAIKKLLDGVDLSSIENFYNQFINSDKSFIDNFKDIITGKPMDYNNLFNEILRLIKENFLPLAGVAGSIISIIILSSFFSAVSPGRKDVSDVSFSVCYLSIALILFGNTINILHSSAQSITNLNKHMQTIFPILLTFVSISGSGVSSASYQSVCVFLSGGIMAVISKYLMPLLSVIIVITSISNLSEKFSLKGLSDFLSDIFKWILGGMVGIFSFFVTIKSITVSAIDGISIRALKYTIGQGIPVIGGFAKEGIDVFLSAGLLIKNSLGVMSLIIIFSLLLIPFVKLVIFSLSLKFLSSIIQPMADSRIYGLINGFAKSIGLAISLIVMVFIMYFVILILIISTQSTIFI